MKFFHCGRIPCADQPGTPATGWMRRHRPSALHNSALTRLPGTVFTDYTAQPELLARDLIR
jgi:hypothetical protein